MSAAHSGTSATGHCIDLINENDTWCIFLCFFKQVADTGSAHTYEHFYKIRTGNGKKWNSRFSGYCLCKKGLTGSWRAY